MSRTMIEIVRCDTCGAEKAQKIKTSVVFVTEQTEGRPIQPYIQIHELDICFNCLAKIIRDGEQIYAHGAQGHNTYYFKDSNDQKES